MSQERSGGVIASSEVSHAEMQVILRGLGTNFSERVAQASSFFFAAQKNMGGFYSEAIDKADKETLFWCKILEEVYREMPESQGITPFCSLLINELYWELPNIKHHSHYAINWAPFMKTKKWIWEKAVKQWEPSIAASEWNLNAFLFLITAFNPRAKDDSTLENESLYERKANGRFITPYEQVQLLELIHQRVKDSPVFLEHWLSFPRVPMEIAKKLAHAWVNERGLLKLRTLFARSAAIGEPKIEDCSKEGIEVLQEWSQLLVDFDQQLQRLDRMLHAADGMPPEVAIKSGAHRYLLTQGNIRVVIRANFEERYAKEETLAIFNRILAVVAEWGKGERGEFMNGVFIYGGRKVNVAIYVEGKRGVFDSFEFSSVV